MHTLPAYSAGIFASVAASIGVFWHQQSLGLFPKLMAHLFSDLQSGQIESAFTMLLFIVR